MKKHTLAISFCSSLLAGFGLLQGATVGVAEDWSGGLAGWAAADLVNETTNVALTVESEAVKVAFKKQSMKTPPEEYLVYAGTAASGGRFTGDYLQAGVSDVRFRFYCEYPTDLSLVLAARESGRMWRHYLPAQPTGQWVTVSVPIRPEILRGLGGNLGWNEFTRDLRDVEWIGITVRRNSSMNAQVCRFDDFQLDGDAEFGEWISRFPYPNDLGKGNRNFTKTGDLDGDGMDNHGEWIAGTSAGNANENLRANVLPLPMAEGDGEEAVPMKTFKVAWDSVEGRKYGVWRTSDLRLPFKLVAGDLPATPPLNTFEDLTSDREGPYFYQIRARKEP